MDVGQPWRVASRLAGRAWRGGFMNDPRYVAARRGLLDALEALADHRDSIIVVGAQAVYLRVAGSLPGISAYTTDGDVAIDSRSLADAPPIGELMSACFELARTPSGGPAGPGHWVQTITVGDRSYPASIDLMVPDGIASEDGRRGARLGAHGEHSARKASGLEAALIDYDWIEIPDLGEPSTRSVEAKVAGPTALLIAKAHEIMRNSPFGVALTKEGMWGALEIPALQNAIDMENRQQIMASATADHREALAAFAEPRPPRYTNS